MAFVGDRSVILQKNVFQPNNFSLVRRERGYIFTAAQKTIVTIILGSSLITSDTTPYAAESSSRGAFQQNIFTIT